MQMKPEWITLDEYAYGWNEKEEQLYALKSGRRQGRVNTIARAYCDHKLIAPFTIEEACNQTVFETWIETHSRRMALALSITSFSGWRQTKSSAYLTNVSIWSIIRQVPQIRRSAARQYDHDYSQECRHD